MASETLTETMVTTAPPVFFQTAPPPLENGDRLNRAEFARRYEAMPHIKKAELIKGKVFMASPVRISVHGIQHSQIIGWLFIYQVATPGLLLGDNSTLRIDDDNEPQPDAVLFIDETHSGGASISADGYLEGAPELIVEIAASTVSYDLHDKLDTYQNAGVREYVVWRVYDHEIDWFALENEKYVRLTANATGLLASRIFPGLWLNANALLNGDLARVVSDLQAGLATPEHAAFIQQLTTNN
jgi:Uma2 family endonuclease